MTAFALADATVRSGVRRAARFAVANPFAAGLLAVLAIASPLLAHLAGQSAASRLAAIVADSGLATQLMLGAATTTAIVTCAFAFRIRPPAQAMPQLAAGAGQFRLVLGAVVLPAAPIVILGALVALIGSEPLAAASPGGRPALIAMGLAQAAVAALALLSGLAVRRPVLAIPVWMTVAGAWIAVAALGGTPAAAGPAGVAGAALGGGADPAAMVLLAFMAVAGGIGAVVLAGRMPSTHTRAGRDRRRRRLPRRPASALGAAAVREALRARDIRGGVAAGLLLAVLGPFAVATLVDLPPFVALALAGPTSAIAVAVIPAAAIAAATQARWMGLPAGSVAPRALGLLTALGLGAVPLAVLAAVLGAGPSDLAWGARGLAIGVIAALVAARIVGDSSRAVFTAVYGLAYAVLALPASLLGGALAIGFAAAVALTALLLPGRKVIPR